MSNNTYVRGTILFHPDREKDLKNQVLSDFLMLKRDARELYDYGQHWPALLKLKTFVSDLVLEDDEYEKVDKLIGIIDELKDEADKFTGETKSIISYKKRQYLSNGAKNSFHRVLREITKILRDANYYSFMLKGGRPPTKEDKTLERLMDGP